MSNYQDTNLSILSGCLTKDSEERELKSGNKVVKFRIAVNNGKKQTTFIDCDWWNPNEAAKYLKTGKKVEVIGRLLFEEWESKNGEKRSKHIINVQTLTLKDGKKREENLADEENGQGEFTKEQFEAELNSLIEG